MKDRKIYHIYGPPHFRATWEKFLEIAHREGQSASELIRGWVESYVARKDPGNPRPPLTSYIKGHSDYRALKVKEVMEDLRRTASSRRNEISLRKIMEALKPFTKGEGRIQAAERIMKELRRRGVKVWR